LHQIIRHYLCISKVLHIRNQVLEHGGNMYSIYEKVLLSVLVATVCFPTFYY